MIPRKPRPNSAPKRVRPAVLGHLPVPKDAQSRTQLGVRIPETTHQQFKLAAVMRGRGVTVQTLVEQAMLEFLSNHPELLQNGRAVQQPSKYIIVFKRKGEGGWAMQLVPVQKQALTRSEFERLADVPPEEEWLANITNEKTKRAYRSDVREFVAYTGLRDYLELRSIVRAHIIGWRQDMEQRALSPATIRRKLSALSSLFDYLCERNAVLGNPVDGVKRPMANGNEGSTPALGDRQARKLLEAPPADTLKGLRDRAILATLLYHGIRREELCGLRVKDMHIRQGVMHFQVKGKRAKIRFIPVNAAAQRTIEEYLARAGHRGDADGPCFGPSRTTAPAASTGTSIRHRSIGISLANTALKPGSAPRSAASACIRCARRRRQTLCHTKPISPRCRSGSGMPMYRQRAFMTGGRASLRTVRPSRSLTDERAYAGRTSDFTL